MTNPALKWLSDAYKGGYLRAAFVDCQRGEYKSLDDKTAFTRARDLANTLRQDGVHLSHFLFDQTKPETLAPFLYKGCAHHRFSNRDMDFQGVIPQSEEWVYPKKGFNGFENPHANAIISTDDEQGRSVLIGGGFKSRLCLKETLLGSFERAINLDMHRVIFALSATNLDAQHYHQYQVKILAEADEHVRDKIGFATNEEIVTTIQQATLLQSSPSLPYRALGLQG